MDKKIIKNYIYNTAVQVINIIVPFITIPYISRVLTPGELGLYNYTLNIMTYFSVIAELGFQFYGQKLIVNSRNTDEEELYFFKVLKLKLIFGFTILLVYLLIVFTFLDNKGIYLFQGIAILGVIIDISWYYAGKEDFKRIAIRGLFLKLASFVLLFVVVRGQNALVKYVLSIQLPNLIGNMLMYYGLGIKFRHVQFAKGEAKRVLAAAFSLLIPSILTSIYQIVDKTILGNLSTMTQVGYYSQMLKLVGVFSLIVYSIGKVVFPRLIFHFHNHDRGNMQLLMREITSFVIHLGIPICIGTYCILDVFVPWFYGEQYLILINYFPYAIPLIMLTSMNHIFSSQLLVAINEEKKLFALITVNIIVNVTLDIILIPAYASIGALAATIIAETIQFTGSMFFYKRIIGGRIFSNKDYKVFMASAAMGIVILLLKGWLPFDQILKTFLLLVIGAAVYFLTLLVLNDPIVTKIKAELLSRIIHDRTI